MNYLRLFLFTFSLSNENRLILIGYMCPFQSTENKTYQRYKYNSQRFNNEDTFIVINNYIIRK